MSCIAVFNAGSSSLKFAFCADGAGDALVCRGQVEKIGIAPRMTVTSAAGETLLEREWSALDFGHGAAARAVLEAAPDLLGGRKLAGAGHRVVHGGTKYAAPVRIDAEVIEDLAKLSPLAPLHQAIDLAPIREIAESTPGLPQVACFDTAFHRTQPEIVQLYAIPQALTEEGVRRYGFHGLSYEFIVGRLAAVAPNLAGGRTIACHLGNGASLCALAGGESRATTMGFTPAEGLMMGTRCGSVDPGLLIYLMDRHGMDARAIEDLVYRKSGLLGVSGISSDMRELKASREPSAALAIELFAYRIVREIGSLAAALGGVDGIVFTGGIGENDADLRARVIAGCGWLGADLVAGDSGSGERRISGDHASAEVWVIPTDEERMIARDTKSVLKR